MLDERVLAVLRRLEEEDAHDEAPEPGQSERSLAIAPTSGALLFALCAGRVGCKVLEIGGSRGYSTIWLGAAARLPAAVSRRSRPSRPSSTARSRTSPTPASATGSRSSPAMRSRRCRGLDGPFGVVFLDAWKEDYEALFGLVRPKLAPAASWSPTTCSPTGDAGRLFRRPPGRSDARRASPFRSTAALR